MITINNKQDYLNILLPEKNLATPIKLGKYSFLNCLPINLPIEIIPDNIITSTFGTPEVINNLLNQDKLHVGPISSYEYLRDKDKYVLLNDISISSQKEVGSVILFSNLNFNDLKNKKIAVAHTSSTSVKLLQLLLIKSTGFRANFTVHHYEKPLEEYLKIYDAVLYIGDPALVASIKIKSHQNIITYDLAELWHNSTGLPMVFGVWVALKSWASQNNDAFEYVNNSLIKAKELGLNQYFHKIISKAKSESGLAEDILVNYYKNQLSYDFSRLQKQSLEYYCCQLKENNLL